MSGWIVTRGFAFLFLFNTLLVAQDSSSAVTTQEARQQAQATVQTSPPSSGNDLAQMRDDLNKMESLNLNMSSEVEFLHDQNLQILLRTNSQMWTILIRDLQRQLARQERQGATPAVKK